MALIERASLEHRCRTGSHSSTETEFNACEVSNRRSTSSQLPVLLSNIISASYKHSPNLLIPDPEFLKLLKTVGAATDRILKDFEIYTVQQLCFYLKEYIKSRQLYDINNVRSVYCGGDPLGKVFHVDHFTICDVLSLISKASTPVLVEPSKNQPLGIVKEDGVSRSFNESGDAMLGRITKNFELSPKKTAVSVNLCHIGNKFAVKEGETSSVGLVRLPLKRSLEEELDKIQDKRICLGKRVSEGCIETVGEEVELRTAPVVYGEDFSDAESIYSIQSKETAVVKDSSDDLWFLKEDTPDSPDLSDIYADEYDIVSEANDESSSDVDDYDSDVFVEAKDFSVSFDGSETDFADGEQSDVEEEKLTRLSCGNNQTWQCLKCRHSNPNPTRLCDECLSLRTDELLRASLSSEAVESDYLRSSQSSTGSRSSMSCSGEIASLSTNLSAQSTDSDHLRLRCAIACASNLHDGGLIPSFSRQESGSTKETKCVEAETGFGAKEGDCGADVEFSANACIICLSEPKDASLVHGRSGHLACCYQCARQLKKTRKPCPVCRRPIEKVIRNYVV